MFKTTIDTPKVTLTALVSFALVARHMNFSRAAEELEVTPTAVSKTVKLLERRLGVRLFDRTTRSVNLTEHGATLYDSLVPALELVKSSVRRVSEAAAGPKRLLRINTSHVAYAALIRPYMPAFARAHPDVEVDFAIDDKLADIVANGFDAGVRTGRMILSEMRSAMEAARRGLGLAYVYRRLAAVMIDVEELVPLFEHLGADMEDLYLYYPNRSCMPGKLRAFIDFMQRSNSSSRDVKT